MGITAHYTNNQSSKRTMTSLRKSGLIALLLLIDLLDKTLTPEVDFIYANKTAMELSSIRSTNGLLHLAYFTLGMASGFRTSGVFDRTAIIPVRPVSKVASLSKSRTSTCKTSSISLRILGRSA